jgi:hypothetical protein
MTLCQLHKFMSRHQNVEQNHNTQVLTNKPFGNVERLKYLKKIVTNQNYTHEEI